MKNFIALLAFAAVISVDKSEAYQLSHKSHQRDAEDVEDVDQTDLCEYDFVACSKTFNLSQKKILGSQTQEEQKMDIENGEAFRNTLVYNQNMEDSAPPRYDAHVIDE